MRTGIWRVVLSVAAGSVAVTTAGLGCGAQRSAGGAGGARGSVGGGSGAIDEGGTPVTVSVPASSRDALTAARAAIAADRPAGADGFTAKWRPHYLAALPYDPMQAVNMALVQQSALQLNQAELGVFAQKGFALSSRQQFGTFFMGYTAIYASHLPLFVSGDSVLHAVHRSYDAILKDLEFAALRPALDDMLKTMQLALPGAKTTGVWPAETITDVDEYLTVARQLLGPTLDPNTGVLGPAATPVAGGSAAAVADLVQHARDGKGLSATLFGSARLVDFSQFTPRGHYDDAGYLASYFRATMWLGRTDMRLLQQTTSGQVVFQRRQFAAALLLSVLESSVAAGSWQLLDEVLRSFVGESDNMLPADLEKLRRGFPSGANTLPDLLAKSDRELAQAIIDGGFGIQRILSQLLVVEAGNEGAPLDRSFLLLGQRFVIDSQVLSNLVYDRLHDDQGHSVSRMMPTPLDVGFAALGNSRTVDLLQDELARYPHGYPETLHDTRVMVAGHEAAFWQGSLYGAWMGALRAASPPEDTRDPAAVGLPSVAATEAWARRVLQMQLASWAELRHDTLLYAKQSYTGIPLCEFPDAYVEPSPALWQALADLGRRGQALAQLPALQGKVPQAASYFTTLAATASMLKDMADRQVAGQPFTADQMVFINQAVELKQMSIGSGTGLRPAGWYPQLFYNVDDANKDGTLVADIHTQPADDAGNIIGKVLHVATGYPRLMVTTFETCSGPRAYAGVVSSYYETTTMDFDRLTDARWTAQLAASPPPATIPWMSGLGAP